ncbi:MAG: preprotein translocase SecA, partial [Lachnospiraceae bacterium]|nr:preprotein translocase SecA [Lachnospiraceae bacterium]
MGIIEKLFGDRSEKEIKRINHLVDAVMDLEEDMAKLSDEELKAKTPYFKKRLAEGDT